MKKIIFTGGGSGGHVTLNAGLIPLFLQDGWQVVYIGSKNGIENEIIRAIDGVQFHAIETGKLRRYFSWQNFRDMLRIPVGILQAYSIIRREKPDIIFSKGGFVSFPVVLAGYLNRCPKIMMHESDVTPGLANKMSLPFVSAFFTTFADTEKYVQDKTKVRYVGPVLSNRLENGDKDRAFSFCGFTEHKPTIMFVGGSLGAKSINEALSKILDKLLEKFNVIHICGKGQLNDIKREGYAQFEFLDKEFKDMMALADVVVSRSGSNAIFELLSRQKPMLLIPLPSKSSRGEQALNANSFKDHGFAEVLNDEKMSTDPQALLEAITHTYECREALADASRHSELKQTSTQQLFEDIVHDTTV
ncbi:MAG: undecaprenyldiphospho-muramoylpentapeptide beta-N-acetylglucosaminyltransferase [Alphaproteobacteria bacterium]|nr:undecaprenyldiphospho-muramoylpentapeptide beta-N-acetylglucosaminyltransferase [Alphaproteobacteria bacterium]